MKKIYYFIFCSFILLISCDEKKHDRLTPAGKLIQYLDNSNVEAIGLTPYKLERFLNLI